ncbi:histidinol-phosphate transaminase [Brevibacterium sp. BRM-1]|uniref:histidinol-phosphate transaminase n=1 Tax=Brevibacterium sp. BRM-1 TaxID=2999062 RepID=UPI00227E12A9|nr:histidinol-phosphate transaminase [Brevibacterium sp. BRM-1]WAL41207.1 histidinol-phosphate transaminase [Brevibacterium sp. BRM-1]
MPELSDLPIRADLRGRSPYGAPQLDVPVALNVNENSYPVPPTVAADIARAVSDQAAGLNRYPDREFTALRGKLASYATGVLERQPSDGAADGPARIDPGQVWAANGSNEVLSHILQAFAGAGRTVMGFTPSYSMHPLIAASTGAAWLEVPRTADFEIDLPAALAAIEAEQPDVVFVCTPNNPTGGSTPLSAIGEILAVSPGIVIVDEAYAEFARPGFATALHLLPQHPRLVVSRTMSKAFAFAGARVGYAVAAPALIDALRLVRLPYHLSALTQAAACAALDHAPELLDNVERLVASRDAMAAALAAAGFEPVPSDANFLLFRGAADPAELWQRFLDHGVLLRDIGIPGCLRVNAGTETETAAFTAALQSIVRAHPEVRA